MCGCASAGQELVGPDAERVAARLRVVPHDPREMGPKIEFICDECGTQWLGDFPYHHWAADKRGVMYLRRVADLSEPDARPLNALP